jgi:hypothetical protein
MGVSEEAGKVTIGFMDVFRKEPLGLALVLMNMCLLGFFYMILSIVAAQRASEIAMLYADKKAVAELLSKCVVPHATSGGYFLPPFASGASRVTDEPKQP